MHRATHPASWPAWFASDADYAAAHAFSLNLWFAVEARKGQALAQAELLPIHV